ncbi:hypothetical protein [Clostridioides sp. ZZV15-6598]|uniref:hypothetical protein n=1 Tax=Clostridioides sp. ZZV15-6598 TaxID=2811501 RepID=UPI001D11B35A|nr:hypothetical protein [Clostridioides sp. ZZV15-6598]
MNNNKATIILKEGKALRFIDKKFDFKTDCIVISISRDEIEFIYYDKEIKDIAHRVMTKEDLNFGDYKLELLS